MLGIRLKLMIPLIALAVLLLAGLQQVVWPRFQAALLEHHLLDEHARAEILGVALIHPLRNHDLAQVYSILESVLEKHSHWKRIALMDADGKQIFPFAGVSQETDAGLMEIRHTIEFFDRPVGTLLIGVDAEPLVLLANKSARETQFLVLALLGLAVLLSFPLQEHLITRPLKALAKASKRMAAGHFGWRLPAAGDDEVGQLIRSFADMRAEIKQSQEKLHQLAHYDSLTALPNRSMFLDRLEHAIAHAHRTGNPLGLLFLDVDNFKAINDTLGHVTGDALVAGIAARLKQIVREDDTIARLGGDEFMVIVETMSREDDAVLAAQRIVDAFAEPVDALGHQIPVTASIGVTTYPTDGKEAAMLVQNADIAMYRAKAAGGGTYRLFADGQQTDAQDVLRIRSQLYYALERDEYFLEFQPRIDLRSGRVDCVEALLRWQPESMPAVSPADFIPLLEQTGMINEAGEWVLRQSCRFVREQRDAGIEPVRVSVNLSARQFSDPWLKDKIETALRDFEIPSRYLELELTESVVMENTVAAIEIFDALHDLGVALSIDDFGTGYSSLAYLKRFPMDYLKIDRSFIRDLPEDVEDAAIVRAIIALSSSLGVAVIAEGVETKDQADFLQRVGCDGVQGYLYSRPLGPLEIVRWLRSQETRISQVHVG